MITATDVTVQAGPRTILRSVGLTVAPGRLVALLGPNGAGKSTIVSVLSGERRPSHGHVALDGVPLDRLSPLALARRRAVVLQQSRLDFDFTVQEVVALGRLPFARTAERRHDAAACAAAGRRAGIDGLAGQPYRTLSGGERQRVQFARALAQIWQPRQDGGEPRYLLLDEPTSALDLRHRRALLRTARDLAAEGAGVLAVLHDLTLAADYADDVVLIDQGRVLAAGETRAVMTEDALSACFRLPVERVRRQDGGTAFLA